MGDRILGCDMSHWNSDSQFDNVLIGNTRFFMLKATEGKTYFDPKYKTRAKKVLQSGKLLGFYHFARPENNTATKEADNFLLRVKEFKGKCIVALDWEGNAVDKNYTTWATEWLSIVEKEMQTLPFIYVSHAYITKWSLDKIMYNRYPLWVAKWGKEPEKGSMGMWDKWTIWQNANTPYDQNIFNGTDEDFEKLYSIENDADEEGSGYCGCCCGCCAKGKQE